MKNFILSLLIIFACGSLISAHFLPQVSLTKDITIILYTFMILSALLLLIDSIRTSKKLDTIKKLITENERLEEQSQKSTDMWHAEKKVHTALKTQVSQLEKELAKYRKSSHKSKEERDHLSQQLDSWKRATQSAEDSLQEAKRKLEAQENSPYQQSQVIQLLNLLQQKGRFLDFLMEDILEHSDEDLGSAARFVHQGCSQIMKEYFKIMPLSEQKEGEQMVLEKDHDPYKFLLLEGTINQEQQEVKIIHRGWVTTNINLPKASKSNTSSHNTGIISPIELEI